MPTVLSQNEDLLFVHKPPGIPTHRPSYDRQGFVEWWEETLQQPLHVCHRLDKETSGILVFAKNKQAASDLTDLFAGHQVKKEYLFVTDKKSEFKHWHVVEEKNQAPHILEGPWKEGSNRGFESVTEFTRIASENSLYLYKAKPFTGKTHQIRKHAVKSEIPLLGDEIYGGKKFPRLLLHSLSIEFLWKGDRLKQKAQPSRLFDNLSWLQDRQWSQWITSYERRETLFNEKINTDQALRLFHQETGDLRGDQVGEQIVLGWWQKTPPSQSEEEKIRRLAGTLNFKNWLFEWRPGVEDKKNTALLLSESQTEQKQESWFFKENDLKFKAHLDRGQNFGLFLDQRNRREWVKNNCKSLRVLNLFAFTCGFSLAAARGGAKEVISVDLSKKYLNWGRENFELNGFNPSEEKFRWMAMDSVDYLTWSQKKGFKYDIIVCDPPSFSRHKKSKKTFKIDRDFGDLIDLCLDRLEAQGTLLFSTNFEKWSLDQWTQQLEKKNFPIENLQVSPSQWDYEWQSKEAGLKAFFLRKA